MNKEANYGVKRWPSVKSKDDRVPSQNQGLSGWTQGPRLPTKVSFKGGSHLGNPNPSFFLACPNLGTRFLLRVVVSNIPSFYQILGVKFLFLFCLCWLKFHRDLTLLSLFKGFIGKTISNFLVNLEELFWENWISKILSCSYPNLCKLICIGSIYKMCYV
jgi:hypothetical protein